MNITRPLHLQNIWTAIALGSLLSGCLVIPIELGPRSLQQSPPTEDTAPGPAVAAAQSQTAQQMEADVWQRINEVRQQNGLQPLESNDDLAGVARQYSRQMAENNFFSHTGADGSTPAERVRSAGIQYRMVGENLFTSTNARDPVPLSVKGWMESPGHRENILRSEYTETGIGVWRDGNTYYFTQLFLRPRSFF